MWLPGHDVYLAQVAANVSKGAHALGSVHMGQRWHVFVQSSKHLEPIMHTLFIHLYICSFIRSQCPDTTARDLIRMGPILLLLLLLLLVVSLL